MARIPRDQLVAMMHQAKAFKQPIVEEFLETTEWKLFKQWQIAVDEVDREKIFLQSQGLKAFRDFIRKVIIDGESAEKELDQKMEKERQQQ